MGVEVGRGDGRTDLPRRAEVEPGKWEDVGSDSVETRELLWRRLQAGQWDVQGGQFTAPGGSRVGTPYADWGWLWFQHEYEAPTTLRYVMDVGKPADEPMTVYLWEPSSGDGVSVRGTLAEFKRAKKNKSATAGPLTIGWEWPEPAPLVDNARGSKRLEVVFTPGPAGVAPLFGSEVYDHLKKRGQL